jgi:hypothetical protein
MASAIADWNTGLRFPLFPPLEDANAIVFDRSSGSSCKRVEGSVFLSAELDPRNGVRNKELLTQGVPRVDSVFLAVCVEEVAKAEAARCQRVR